MLDVTPIAVTHDGRFHADDVLAAAVLRCVHPGIVFVRTRNAEAIAAADIVFDVGAVYDPEARRYDHHQRERPHRPDGTPFSAFGLVWLHHGREFLSKAGAAEADVEVVWDAIDRSLVISVDRTDNGVREPVAGDMAFLVGEMNPVWDAGGGADLENAAFGDAVRFASAVLARAADHAFARVRAGALLSKAAKDRADPRILVLDDPLPWHDTIHEPEFDDTLFVVHPSRDGASWHCVCVPPSPGSFAQRLPLPTAWRALRDGDLAKVTGVADAIYCHASGFVCGAASRGSAIALAKRATGQVPTPEDASGPAPAP